MNTKEYIDFIDDFIRATTNGIADDEDSFSVKEFKEFSDSSIKHELINYYLKTQTKPIFGDKR